MIDALVALISAVVVVIVGVFGWFGGFVAAEMGASGSKYNAAEDPCRTYMEAYLKYGYNA